jgi:subtilisin family serine protease
MLIIVDIFYSKIVGARYYNDIFGEDFLNKTSIGPRDTVGHGTHVASIAAGNPISKASMLGMGEGTTRGGASSARIAVYKVCWTEECDSGRILTAFKDAIADGVDILSVSIGGRYLNKQHFTDAFSVGAFLAMKHGILTVFAAGNRGPDRTSVQHISPWAISVAASTLDRKFVTKVILGDGTTYEVNLLFYPMLLELRTTTISSCLTLK